MKTVLEAWGEADLGPARAAFADDIVWRSASSGGEDAFCFGGIYRGREAVLGHLYTLSTRYYFRRYTAKEIISQGEIVWGVFDVRGNYFPRPGSEQDRKPIAFENAFRWRVRDGKILESQSFFDTASLLVQQGALLTQAA
jgi:ketosteroid isomerase-like protein